METKLNLKAKTGKLQLERKEEPKKVIFITKTKTRIENPNLPVDISSKFTSTLS